MVGSEASSVATMLAAARRSSHAGMYGNVGYRKKIKKKSSTSRVPYVLHRDLRVPAISIIAPLRMFCHRTPLIA